MSYQGQIAEIPIGLGGLSGGRNFSTLRPDQLIQANNISFTAGTVQREGGSAKYNSVTLGAFSVIGGWDWWPSANAHRVVVILGSGAILKDSTTTTFPVALGTLSTLSSEMVPLFVEGGKEGAANNRKLFIFTGLNPVKVLSGDGAAVTNLSTPPTDWAGTNQPVGGAIHENRLWGWGNANDPHRVYASLSTNHEDFTTTPFSLAVFPGEGEKIISGLSYKGALILWKYPAGVYFIDTSSATSSQWRPIRLAHGGGGVSPMGAVVIDNDILSIDRDGNFQMLSATADYGDMRSNNLSTIADFNQYVRGSFNTARLHMTRAVYYPAKREAHFSLPAIGQTVNNRRIVVDFNKPDLPRFRVSDKDTCESIWIGKQVVNGPLGLMSGDSSGFVWKLDQAGITKDGQAYTSKFQTVHSDLSFLDQGLAAKRKLGDFLELVFERRNDATLYVDVVWDGRTAVSLPFVINSNTARWNAGFKWGQFRWATNEFTKIRRRIVGSGVRLSLIFRCSAANEDFSVIKALLYFRPADEGRP